MLPLVHPVHKLPEHHAQNGHMQAVRYQRGAAIFRPEGEKPSLQLKISILDPARGEGLFGSSFAAAGLRDIAQVHPVAGSIWCNKSGVTKRQKYQMRALLA